MDQKKHYKLEAYEEVKKELNDYFLDVANFYISDSTKKLIKAREKVLEKRKKNMEEDLIKEGLLKVVENGN